MRVSASVSSAFTVPPVTETAKLFALRFARLLRVRLLVVVLVPVVVPVPVVEPLVPVFVPLRRRGRGRRSQSERLGQRDAEVTNLVAVDRQDGDVDDDLWSCAVKVTQQLLSKQELVWRRAHHNRVLRGHEIDLDAGIKQVADRRQDLVGIVLLTCIGEIEGLHGKIVKIGSIGTGVLRDEDGIRRDRLIEGARLDAHDAKSVRKRHVRQVDRDALGGVLRIEEDVQAGELADRLVDVSCVLYRVDGDRIIRDRLQRDRSGNIAKLRCGVGRARDGWRLTIGRAGRRDDRGASGL